MEATHPALVGDEPAVPRAKLSSRVILGLDHFSAPERTAVDWAVQAFARGDAAATRLPDAEPLYLVRATPNLLVIVRRDADDRLVVEDLVTQEAWDHLAHAG